MCHCFLTLNAISVKKANNILVLLGKLSYSHSSPQNLSFYRLYFEECYFLYKNYQDLKTNVAIVTLDIILFIKVASDKEAESVDLYNKFGLSQSKHKTSSWSKLTFLCLGCFHRIITNSGLLYAQNSCLKS